MQSGQTDPAYCKKSSIRDAEVFAQIRENKKKSLEYDTKIWIYEDHMDNGDLDLAKVVRVGLQNAGSNAGTALSTKILIRDFYDENDQKSVLIVT